MMVQLKVKYLHPQGHSDVKKSPTLDFGAVHLFNEIKNIRSVGMPADEEALVLKYVQINGYMAHPENLLLAMVGKLIL